jgi:hypothetical protein
LGQDYQVNPSLHIDLGGLVPGADFDLIDAPRGEVELMGGLFVKLIDSFVPQLGNHFQIITGNVIEPFDVAFFPQAPPGLLMTANYTATDLTLSMEEIKSVVAFADPDTVGIAGVPNGAALGDFDNDGDLDLVICMPSTPPSGNSAAFVLLNGGVDGAGNWLGFTSASSPFALGVHPVSVTVGHFDTDAWLDFAVANQASNSVMKFQNLGTGNATFGAPLTIAVASPTAVASGELSDAWDSLAIAQSGGTATIRRFTSTGSLSATVTALTAGINPVDVMTLDVDNDTDNDLIVLNTGDPGQVSRASVHQFDSKTATFSEGVFYPLGMGALDFASADLNNDDFVDVFAANHDDGTFSVLVNHADGSGEFAVSAVNVPVGIEPTSIASLDAEPDGDLDLATMVLNESGEPVIRLARNDLNGGQTIVFSDFNDIVTDEDTVLVRSGDMNGDGVSDVVSINAASSGVAGGGAVGSVSTRLNIGAVRACPADIFPSTGDGIVNVDDLLFVILNWGPNSGPADIAPPGGDGVVNVDDLLAVIFAWGACP